MSVFLDWSRNAVGPLSPCRYCRKGAFMRDAEGVAAHKVCAERALAKTATQGAKTP